MWLRSLLAVQMAVFPHFAHASRDPSPYGINSILFSIAGLAAVIALRWWENKDD